MDRKRERVKNLNDEDLIRSFLNNDQQSFNHLVRKYQDLVFNLCYRFFGDYDDANDCAQEIFVKIYKSLKGFKFQSSFSTWLYRISMNTCKSKRASLEYRLRKHSISLNMPRTDNPNSSPIEIRDDTYAPDKILFKKETESIIQKAIASLPAKQKVLVVLRDIDGLSYEEISQITELKLGTVKSKLARARNLLIKKLKGVI